MTVDCMACPVRGQRCDDCVVTLLLTPESAELPLDAAESAAVSIFVGAGLVSAASASGLHARREPVDYWETVRAVG
jgi:hypothetical protein